MVDNSVLAACKQAIEAWQIAFNQQDAKGCAKQYGATTVMHARPFGTFEGQGAIEAFWQGIIDQGFKDVVYTNVHWEPIGENGYVLTATWQMNKAFGIIHKEHWVMEEDGKARLASDDFEVLGEL
ncbi:isochorismatase [Shewanella sp. M16]|nr:nuclear transport factor 2 family protein [Shewanella sp. WE21]AVI68758.1 isochorismatase [Shewanella sp. WE21]MBS0044977.1 isochorismatase [Shewanella sp. M16]